MITETRRGDGRALPSCAQDAGVYRQSAASLSGMETTWYAVIMAMSLYELLVTCVKASLPICGLGLGNELRLASCRGNGGRSLKRCRSVELRSLHSLTIPAGSLPVITLATLPIDVLKSMLTSKWKFIFKRFAAQQSVAGACALPIIRMTFTTTSRFGINV